MKRTYIQENLEKEFAFQHLIDDGNFSMDFHCHDHIEVFLSISGGENFIIDDRIYEMKPHDLFVNNQLEVHRTIAQAGERYERYVLSFKPSFVLPYNTPDTDLLHYIYRRPNGFSNKISLSQEQFDAFTDLTARYEAISNDSYASDVLRRMVFVEMLAYTARFFRRSAADSEPTASAASGDMVSVLLKYISSHIAESLSLDELASLVNVTKFHMCKVFKAKTGTTINKYIVMRRIAEAKYLLLSGVSVTDACYLSGFNDLSHFIRTFHTTVGTSPGKYLSDNKLNTGNYYFGPEMNVEASITVKDKEQ